MGAGMSGEFSISATLKGGTGYDAPWVVIYANDPGELKAKLAGIAEQGVLQATVEAANLLKGANNAAPLLAGGEQAAPPQQAPAQPVQQAPQQSAWGQQPVQQQPFQQQAPQGGFQQGGEFQKGQPHPQGTACHCGQVLVFSPTQNGKKKFQCPQWRWNNGNPNDHAQEWVK